ncbi:MAG: GNAT family N-acetyltransferase, partial [Planctomycetota bacterium]
CRGRPPMHIDRLIEVLMRFSYLIADCPEIAELDMNPVLVTPDDVIALDARVILDDRVIGQDVAAYSHLAIRPYPEQFVRKTELSNGTPVTLRPIRPEDEPLWHELVANSSEETLYKRFNYIFGPTDHELAVRYCFIDYDREIAIVCEHEKDDGQREFIGIARLIADPDHDSAEYATLVADAWQGKGAGTLLMQFCLDIAREWKIRRLTASTTRINTPMVRIFENSGFKIDESYEDQVVMVNMEL